jgi:hypothetical protein
MQIGYAPEAIEICSYGGNSDCIVIQITNILKFYNEFLPLKLNCIQEAILFYDVALCSLVEWYQYSQKFIASNFEVQD